MLLRAITFFATLLIGLEEVSALEPDEVFSKVSKSIVVVVGLESNDDVSLGSGVIIDAGEVVTNCHVIEDAVRIAVAIDNFESIAKVRFSDPERDLCQLTVINPTGFETPVAELVRSIDLRVGERVYAIGTPQGLDLTLSDGLISSLRQTEFGTIIQTNAPVSEGSSGGGLFDSEGRLAGITTFIFSEGQNLNFAIPADWIPQLELRVVDRVEAEKKRLVERRRRLVEERKRVVEARRLEQLRIEVEQRRAENERLLREKEAAEAQQRKLQDLADEFWREDQSSARERTREDEWEIRFPKEAEQYRRKHDRERTIARERELVDDYVGRIQAKIYSRVVIPPNMPGNPEVVYEVILLPGGDILQATLKKSSGVLAYDSEVVRAIAAAQPLPVPDEPKLFQRYFRKLNLSFRPKKQARQ